MHLATWLRQWARAIPDRLRLAETEEAAYEIVGDLLRPFVQRPIPPEVFRQWEERGFHLTPNHFYSPIPELRSLPESLWRPRDAALGIDFNDATALDLLTRRFPVFRDEYDALPTGAVARPDRFTLDNPHFSGTDALVLYCMVRHFRPRRIVEVGCGHSSLLSGQAATLNGGTELVCIEPGPSPWLRAGFAGLTRLIELPVQEAPLSLFTSLGEGDVLFIDGSHVVRTGGDVVHLFLEVLPRLAPGVLVHVHDIFLPDDYPRRWLTDLHYFWSEQYLLHAFLLGNVEWEVVFANTYMARAHPQAMRETFPRSPWWGGGSFWMRRRAHDLAPPAPG